MARYKVTNRYIAFPDETYEEGDVIEDPPEAVLDAFGDRLVEIEASDGELPDPSEYTIDEFEEHLEDGRYDERLDELSELEENGDARDGIQQVIEDRR